MGNRKLRMLFDYWIISFIFLHNTLSFVNMFKYFTTKAPIGRQVARQVSLTNWICWNYQLSLASPILTHFQARSYTVATKRVSNSYAVPTAGAIVGAIGFYAFSTQSNVKSESKRSLTGDGEWVDFKVKETKDLSHNVSIRNNGSGEIVPTPI